MHCDWLAKWAPLFQQHLFPFRYRGLFLRHSHLLRLIREIPLILIALYCIQTHYLKRSCTHSRMLLRIWALLSAVIMCPGASSTILCISFARAPMSPGVNDEPDPTKDDPDGAVEVIEDLTSLLLLALDILKGQKRSRTGTYFDITAMETQITELTLLSSKTFYLHEHFNGIWSVTCLNFINPRESISYRRCKKGYVCNKKRSSLNCELLASGFISFWVCCKFKFFF